MYITQGLKRAVQVNRRGIATIDGERQRTWGTFVERVAKFAGALKKLGLRPQGRVAILSLNSDYYLECFFAIAWAGGIVVPLNIRLAMPELVYMLNDAGVQILVVDETHKDKLPELLPQSNSIQHVILTGEGTLPDDALRYEDILMDAAPLPDVGYGGDDVVGIFYTGGTTGLSKGVMLSHTNLISNAITVLLNIYEGEPWVYLHSAPMFHIADAQWMVGVTMQAGTHVFMPKFIPEEMLKNIQKYKVTHCALVPTMVNMLLNLSNRDQYDVSTLRGMNYGGSPMAPALISRARQAFPKCRLFQGYGQTETSPNVSMLVDKFHDPAYASKFESAGQPMLTVEVRIVDEDDHELPIGEVGEIVVRGPNIMKGYWNKPEETAHALRGGWMHTGDIGFMDEDGFLYIVDRLKDVIISGGENVYSVEVEAALYQHPAVAVCAVIGIPDAKWGESVHAIVVLRDGESITAETLIEHCRTRIAGYKCPRSIEIRHEPLPMSGAGKILKRELRAPYWAGMSRAVN
ncbi:MAG: long-chain-fatty-acid--CoA ligase [Anaerolineae bacterium]|jgi:long-chain acyl-CoA synthetase|nr:MAG: long-chain-fatty-acid--CoA ligase [Anaerolineae bacterium]MCL4877942.1 long-chain-fatty-acid--CoA ligase [Anaerolineae bacterium]